MSKTLTLNMNDGTKIFCDDGTWDNYTYNEKWFVITKDNRVVDVYDSHDIFSISVENYEMIAYNKYGKPLYRLYK